MLFNQLGLSAELLRAVEKQGYQTATPIQQQAIPLILEGRDILAGAQTGTGKTAGFTLPMLQRLQNGTVNRRRIRALVLTPTRELAAQVADSVRCYGQYLPFRAAVIYGGVSINTQIAKLRKGVDVVVATPGRLLDHLQQGTIDLGAIECLVLDEADRMLDMGFIRDIRKIMKVLPNERQNLLFSATFSKEIRGLAKDLLNSPSEISVATHGKPAEGIDQLVYRVDRQRKRELLSHTIGSQDWRQVLVFTRTKHGANRLATQLESDGLKSAAIHGNKSQGARLRALQDFKTGKVRVLVATDVAARGLDIERLPHVVNYELPHVPEDYVHRIGRTARAGHQGHAVSLVCVDEHKLLADIEKLLQMNICKETVPGYEPDPRIKAEPITRGRVQRSPSRKKNRRNTGRPASAKGRNSGKRRSSGRQM
ncbi:MAG: DEAD/DEAH box helicase [Woeseiaceae bacterium]|nr:DEAD/DEAH box helicase [Gammaproteobacteria bacterium]NNF49866.1 DEAD/DEAH box helicase [Woeseiaceae bacterium]NNK24799.1 DEAD/DEAH box helicase [Woeseiaceae bacterium]